jgi:hypothetical protein
MPCALGGLVVWRAPNSCGFPLFYWGSFFLWPCQAWKSLAEVNRSCHEAMQRKGWMNISWAAWGSVIMLMWSFPVFPRGSNTTEKISVLSFLLLEVDPFFNRQVQKLCVAVSRKSPDSSFSGDNFQDCAGTEIIIINYKL